MTNELQTIVEPIKGAIQQMQNWPIAVLVIAVLIVLGGVLKMVAIFPNKYIPIAVLVLGTAGYAVLGDPGSVSPTQRFPVVVLSMHGFMLGFVAWTLHATILKRLEKFIPILAGRTGDTEFTTKDKP